MVKNTVCMILFLCAAFVIEISYASDSGSGLDIFPKFLELKKLVARLEQESSSQKQEISNQKQEIANQKQEIAKIQEKGIFFLLVHSSDKNKY